MDSKSVLADIGQTLHVNRASFQTKMHWKKQDKNINIKKQFSYTQCSTIITSRFTAHYAEFYRPKAPPVLISKARKEPVFAVLGLRVESETDQLVHVAGS